ncbi:hypothetical protein QTI19_08050 [Variovorax sp. J22R203]|nr:hypothetical protein [Variovorax sp. J22G73]MDM0004716.1 hypothetical protein [Variovorax sp. J22R203]
MQHCIARLETPLQIACDKSMTAEFLNVFERALDVDRMGRA